MDSITCPKCQRPLKRTVLYYFVCDNPLSAHVWVENRMGNLSGVYQNEYDVVATLHRAFAIMNSPDGREQMGIVVRRAWVTYCEEIGDTNPQHLAPWEAMPPQDQEVDRRIAAAVLATFAEYLAA